MFVILGIENKEVCEFLILNVEALERELIYLLFNNPVLEEMEQANFASSEDFADFYHMITIISEIFHSILVRKQKEAFEHMRERGLTHSRSAHHTNAILNAQSNIERIISYVCVIKIKGWMVSQQYKNRNLQAVLFDANSEFLIAAKQYLNNPTDVTLEM